MTTLADDIKLLRELDAKRPTTGKVVNFSVRLKEIWDADACESFKNMTDRACAYSEAIRTINALVELVGDMQYHLITAQTVAVNIAAEMVRCDDMPSSYPEDYKRKVPRWILRQIADAQDFQVGRGNRLKKGCIDEIAECKRKFAPIAALAKGE